MKRKDFSELKEKTVEQLTKMASEKRTEALKKKMSILAGREKNLKMHRNLRAEVAKILTLIREKEILAGLEQKPAEPVAEVKKEVKKEEKKAK